MAGNATPRRKLDLTPEQRAARSARARELHERGVFGGAGPGSKGGRATAAKAWETAPEPVVEYDAMSKDELSVELLAVLTNPYMLVGLRRETGDDADLLRSLTGVQHDADLLDERAPARAARMRQDAAAESARMRSEYPHLFQHEVVAARIAATRASDL